MIEARWNSLSNAMNGLKVVWKEEHNFRIEVFATLVVVFFIFYFKFTFIESALCILAIVGVFCAEIINTVVEDLCNKIEPHHDERIGKIKDTAGAFVLVSALGAFVIGVLVFSNHFL